MTQGRVRKVMVAALMLVVLNGCAVTQDAVKFAQDALDPGVPGRKPVTAEEAAQLSDEQIAQRLAFIAGRLDENRTHAAWWYYGFLTVNAVGMTAGAATAAVEDNKDDQIYNILNASLGLIGTGYMLAAPLPGRSGADPITDMPSATHPERAAQLAEAEAILYDAAGRARQRTGWLLTTGNVVMNASAASVLLARVQWGQRWRPHRVVCGVDGSSPSADRRTRTFSSNAIASFQSGRRPSAFSRSSIAQAWRFAEK